MIEIYLLAAYLVVGVTTLVSVTIEARIVEGHWTFLSPWMIFLVLFFWPVLFFWLFPLLTYTLATVLDTGEDQ